jgi:NADPH:quinone reductase-like Zn-dependent oxidoreductase
MKKISIYKPGSFDQLVIEECPNLTPKDHEVLIKVRAIGVNFADVCVRLGVYESAKKYVGQVFAICSALVLKFMRSTLCQRNKL